jgi:hypothetical protein
VPAEIGVLLRHRQHGAKRASSTRPDRAGRAADFVIMDQRQHTAGKNLLDSVR